ncbi:helix-turn-helix transcriptional regulator [Glycomyces buryatensis]|uniref:Response regulator transcription factor n=1 Tax=Glycomyces buryatensis TaxID=2570927 RepID=A0A4S8QQR4_9ACTN|nr:LuxR C-terminal-related transcriptional regulator [Glycomyces buryatensis]THV43064.1 response regulator transcription factor [Glycomyces buryatensis]
MASIATAQTTPTIDTRWALNAARAMVETPLCDWFSTLARSLSDLIEHRAAAYLTGYCPALPLKLAGDPSIAEAVTSVEIAALAGLPTPGRPWHGRAVMGGRERQILAVDAAAPGADGTLLVLIDVAETPPGEEILAMVQEISDLGNANLYLRTQIEPQPSAVVQSQVTASERGRVVDELTDSHTAALTGLLRTLRSNSLDDATARRTAVDLAVTALLDLRNYAERDHAVSEQSADAAFAEAADDLRTLLRHGPVRLDLRPPESNRPIPTDTANFARFAVRSTVLSMLRQEALQRLHVGWQVREDALVVAVRDDGPGTLTTDALAVHRIEQRLRGIGGELVIDAVPGWGTTATVSLPLEPTATVERHPLADLNPRELEVMDHLSRGSRNRAIAEDLHISESTVKFHVAAILRKLGAANRGEAAAMAREA